VVDDFKKLTYVASSGTELNYRFFEPKTESDKKYPLVLFLHGTGERGSDNETQLLAYEGALVWAKPEQQSKNPCYVIAPQAPMADKATSFWTDEPVYSMVLSLIKEAIDKYPIDANRIYITGLSNGGTGTWYIAGTNTDLFAAAVPICGRSNRSFGNRTCLPEIGTVCLYVPANSEILSAVKDMPIWVLHAADDPICDVRNSRDAVENIKALGGTSINYTEFNAGTVKPYGHAAWAPAYENNDMITWLFEQSK
jgi:predicted peptidase